MEGKFTKKSPVLGIFFLLAGGAIFLKHLGGGKVFLLILGAVICVLGACLLCFNFRAYFHIRENRITARYHFFGKLDLDIGEVAFAYPQLNMLTLLLKDGKRKMIGGMSNSWQMGKVISKRSYSVEQKTAAELTGMIDELQAKRKRKIYGTAICAALMFVIIFAGVWLTGGRDLNEFDRRDWTVIAVMAVLLLADVVLCFCFAEQGGRLLLPIAYLKYRLQGAVIANDPLPQADVKTVYTDGSNSARYVIYSFGSEEALYCSVQRFGSGYQLETAKEDIPIEEMDEEELCEAEMVDITNHFIGD